MIKKINIPAAFNRVNDQWSPHVAAQLNGQEIRIAKIEGPFEWHHHEGADEGFFVVKGTFTMRFRDKDVAMEEGDLIVVPAGVEHMPDAAEECWIMMFEPADTLNTGEHQSDRSKHDLPVL